MKKRLFVVLITLVSTFSFACSKERDEATNIETMFDDPTEEKEIQLPDNDEISIDNQEEQEVESIIREDVNNYGLYIPILLQVENQYGYDMVYHLYDMNMDGVEELIVMEKTCEADAIWSVYTIDDNNTIYMGWFPASHSYLCSDKDGNILCVSVHMGGEYVYKIVFDGTEIIDELISNREISPDEEYEGIPNSLEGYYVSDYSIIPIILEEENMMQQNYLVSYINKTINEVAEIWGEHYILTSYLFGGGQEVFIIEILEYHVSFITQWRILRTIQQMERK